MFAAPGRTSRLPAGRSALPLRVLRFDGDAAFFLAIEPPARRRGACLR
jgi:hypothetical protein